MRTYSFDQIGLMARCILTSRVSMLNAILGPVVGATSGADWSGHTVSGGKKPRAKSSSYGPGQRSFSMGDKATAEEKERGLLSAFAKAGLRVSGTSSNNA
jgi:hypothetical protein